MIHLDLFISQFPRTLIERIDQSERATKIALAIFTVSLTAAGIGAAFVFGSVEIGLAVSALSLVCVVAAVYFRKNPAPQQISPPSPLVIPIPQRPFQAPQPMPRPAPGIPNDRLFDRIHVELEKIWKELQSFPENDVKEGIFELLKQIEQQSKDLLDHCSEPEVRAEICSNTLKELKNVSTGYKEMTDQLVDVQTSASVFYIEARTFKEDQIHEFRQFVDQNRAYININSGFGTILHRFAIKGGPLKFVEILAKNGADFSVRENSLNNTALHWAIANAHNSMAMELLKWLPQAQYSSLNLPSTNQNTVLHLAIGKGYEHMSADGQHLEFTNCQIAAEILNRGANPNLQNQSGNTALHYAYIHQNKEMIDLLIRHGARKDIPNNAGQLPEDLLHSSLEQCRQILHDDVHVFLIKRENNLPNHIRAL